MANAVRAVKTVDVVRGIDRLRGTLSPLRRAILVALREPASATEIAGRLGETRQRIGYHVRELERGGFVELVRLRQRRGCTERVVRATAHAVLVDPHVTGDLAAVTQDRFAVDALIAMAARTVSDVAAMRERAHARRRRLATFAIEADVGFAEPVDIERFAGELAECIARLAAKYDTGQTRRRYRVVAGGHPATNPSEGR